LKRIVSILLISAFLFNSVGIVVIFFHQKSLLKREFKLLIKNKRTLSDLEIIKITKTNLSSLHFTNADSGEFRFNGKMFDVVKLVRTQQHYIFYCINDEKEEQLLSSFSKNVESLVDLKDSFKKNLNKLIRLYTLDFFQEMTEKNILPTHLLLTSIEKNNLLSVTQEIEPPPPRLIS